ncbi:hypothetical protein GCM10022403_075470 [Streptomyces coacervatus]|uniref:Class I SAM-dependent methyltransferase n=1 Tax=Streptomyces coacervatus TaxID=647381 RepID=A0ABP7IZV4_9ACTN|nr:hypothetical protein [Streptomyces coacervatus]MDF2270021.1 hypothetical protein [Streptomyces coacervatus]
MTDPYRNHNVHHHPVVLAAMPDRCEAALDIGCGDRLLARKLAAKAARLMRSPAGMPVRCRLLRRSTMVWDTAQEGGP